MTCACALRDPPRDGSGSAAWGAVAMGIRDLPHCSARLLAPAIESYPPPSDRGRTQGRAPFHDADQPSEASPPEIQGILGISETAEVPPFQRTPEASPLNGAPLAMEIENRLPKLTMAGLNIEQAKREQTNRARVLSKSETSVS